ncbi:MAG: DUF1848 family protein [Desulfobacterales bacterium]|jgi:hypothetical protein|nr:DUF1848 family protein [Desulfobacterales bacterium]
MTIAPRCVLSASRRTDIPAFYLDWFLEGIRQGAFDVRGPYQRQPRRVPASVAAVHTIVFWSKDFGPFLRRRVGEQLQRQGFHLFFNFTVNSRDRILEPRVPELKERLDQLAELARRFSPEAIHWRFDPICHYRTSDGRTHDNRGDFQHIADAAAAAGIRRCITSFVDLYPKVGRRAERVGVWFQDPPMTEKTAILEAMAEALRCRRIGLETCCEAKVLDHLPVGTDIRAGACIPSDRLMALFGGHLSLRQDSGQRRRAGCRCRVSVDIGSYALHPCHHNCLFCYARPTGAVSTEPSG